MIFERWILSLSWYNLHPPPDPAHLPTDTFLFPDGPMKRMPWSWDLADLIIDNSWKNLHGHVMSSHYWIPLTWPDFIHLPLRNFIHLPIRGSIPFSHHLLQLSLPKPNPALLWFQYLIPLLPLPDFAFFLFCLSLISWLLSRGVYNWVAFDFIPPAFDFLPRDSSRCILKSMIFFPKKQ